MNHQARAHAKYSASQMERICNCPGSVALSERAKPLPDNKWALEGTKAHEHLEHTLKTGKAPDVKGEMRSHVLWAARYLKALKLKLNKPKPLIETKVSLEHIHPEMFGTLDVALVDLFGELHILDFKYGTKRVNPERNLQLIFYALGVAHQFDYNFESVVLTILQPRACGIPLWWRTSVEDLQSYETYFRKAVERVENQKENLFEGSWCYWCPARMECPKKRSKHEDEVINVFANSPLEEEDGEKDEEEIEW